MSVIYCDKCDKQIDTDFNAEHFDEHNTNQDRHIFRSGIDNKGEYQVCECGYKVYHTNQDKAKSVDDLLEAIWWHGESYGTGLVSTADGTKDENLTTAKQELLKSILSVLPEKIEVENCCGSSYHKGEKDGYNQAIDQTTEAIKRYFKGEV